MDALRPSGPLATDGYKYVTIFGTPGFEIRQVTMANSMSSVRFSLFPFRSYSGRSVRIARFKPPATQPPPMASGYAGVFGAFPYAFRESESWLFKLYVAVSAVAIGLITLFVGAALVVLIGQTAAVQGGSLTLSRSFYVVVGLLVVLPAIAPTLLVARRRRRGSQGSKRHEAALAVAGFLFLLSIYLGVVASMPETFTLDGEAITRPSPDGAFAPVVATLDTIPSVVAWSVPLAGAALVGLVHRVFG